MTDVLKISPRKSPEGVYNSQFVSPRQNDIPLFSYQAEDQAVMRLIQVLSMVVNHKLW